MVNDLRRLRVSPGVAAGVLERGYAGQPHSLAGRGVARVLPGQGVALSRMGPDACECAGAHSARGVRLQCNQGLGNRRML
jgi:hypothetical protein